MEVDTENLKYSPDIPYWIQQQDKVCREIEADEIKRGNSILKHKLTAFDEFLDFFTKRQPAQKHTVETGKYRVIIERREEDNGKR